MGQKTTFSLNFVGDIMPGTSYPDTSYLPGNDWKQLLDNVSPYLQNADYTTGNLEGVLLKGNLKAKSCNTPNYFYSFKIPPHYTSLLTSTGFDVVNLANNHSLDFGKSGVDSTRRVLKKAGIGFCGLTGDSLYLFKSKTLTICQLGFSSYSFSYQLKSREQCRKFILKAKSLSEIVVVMFHGGAEGAKSQDLPRTGESQFGVEHGSLVEFARFAVDCGADLVIGSGPHVLRGIELYKDRLIAYSLGNFCTYAGMNIKGPLGIGALLSINVNKDGSFHSGKIIPTIQKGRGVPIIDSLNEGINRMKELSALDFPESYLEIKDDGVILKSEKNNMNLCRSGKFYVVVGSFQLSETSLNQINRMGSLGFNPYIIHYFDEKDRLLYRIVVNEFNKLEEARAYVNSTPILVNNKAWVYKCR